MKRPLFMLLIVVVALVTALPAAGKGKPDKPDTPGGPGPAPGVTCEEAGYATWDDYLPGESFTLNLAKGETACVDVVAPAGDWTVSVTEASGVRRAIIRVQDSVAPGDLCGDPDELIDGPLSKYDFYTLTGLPGAEVNACGTEFAELIDGEEEFGPTGETHPLAFVAFALNGKKGMSFTIEVTPPSS